LGPGRDGTRSSTEGKRRKFWQDTRLKIAVFSSTSTISKSESRARLNVQVRHRPSCSKRSKERGRRRLKDCLRPTGRAAGGLQPIPDAACDESLVQRNLTPGGDKETVRTSISRSNAASRMAFYAQPHQCLRDRGRRDSDFITPGRKSSSNTTKQIFVCRRAPRVHQPW